MSKTAIIALASARPALSLEDGLERVERLVTTAAEQKAEIVCFPEAYLPGLRGQDFPVMEWEERQQELAFKTVAHMARDTRISIILGMERITRAGRQITAVVFDDRGNRQGIQTKNQLDPGEDKLYVPGGTRRMFLSANFKFGIAICHEGWRYPETVRWAATRGAKIVFHPQHTGNEQQGIKLKKWGAADSPYYEKAMTMRARENTIYFASVNYALHFPESATALIAPDGELQAHLPYGEEGVLVQEIDLDEATGLLAKRYAPDRYQEER
jgi:N-carbamoylputrescine amidase